MKLKPGAPYPLGATWDGAGVNFALFSEHATGWRGDERQIAELGSRLAGSSDLYEPGGRGPSASVNFVTAHDGFTLADLVSYRGKRNERTARTTGTAPTTIPPGTTAPRAPPRTLRSPSGESAR